ncbi:MAG: hypothetical protein Q9178_002016 [Gyalolechia marmorata]
MESTVTANEATAMQEPAWNEARIESSMAQLQEMHARLCNLRDAVSRLVDPMLVHQTSPEELYTTFAKNVTRTQTDVQEFRKLYHDGKSKEIFERAAKSRSQYSGDIRGWRVTEHEDWLDLRDLDIPRDVRAERAGPDSNSPPDPSVEDLRAAVEQFKNNHPGIDASLDNDIKDITVCISGDLKCTTH